MSEIPKSPFPELISDEQWSPIFIVFIMAFIGVALYQARMIWIMSGGTAQLSPDDLEELQAMSGFSTQQLKMLYRRFKRLDKTNNGSICSEDMQSIPELSMNPLLPRIIAVFDDDGTDSVNFSRFVRILSVFRPECDKEEKIEFMFRIYDIDGDGYISRENLYEVLKMCVGPNLRDEDVHMVVEQTIKEADTIDNDGRISREEFSQAVYSDDTSKKLSVQFKAGLMTIA